DQRGEGSAAPCAGARASRVPPGRSRTRRRRAQHERHGPLCARERGTRVPRRHRVWALGSSAAGGTGQEVLQELQALPLHEDDHARGNARRAAGSRARDRPRRGRALAAQTGIRDIYLEQLYTFGSPGRDPAGRVVSVAYVALIAHGGRFPPRPAGEKYAAAAWRPVRGLPPLAYDHAAVVATAAGR